MFKKFDISQKRWFYLLTFCAFSGTSLSDVFTDLTKSNLIMFLVLAPVFLLTLYFLAKFLGKKARWS